MRRRVLRILAVAGLVLLPFVVHGVYLWMTALPGTVRIGSGAVGGEYRHLSESLSEAIEDELGIRVELVETAGSLENLDLLAAGRIDIALYQPRTLEVIRESLQSPARLAEDDATIAGPDAATTRRQFPGRDVLQQVAFVANLYSQPAHFLVRRDANINMPSDLRNRAVCLGLESSGDLAMSLVLLRHLGLKRSEIDERRLSYPAMITAFENGSLDAAFVTMGINAPFFEQLFAAGNCELREIPYASALTLTEGYLTPDTIPAGLYRTIEPVEPATDIRTVSLRAQLLTRAELPDRLISQITSIVTGQEFIKRNRLTSLFEEGVDYARARPEYDIHPGARAIYEPELRPILNSDFVEATEGLRSFIVSVLIAAYLLYRWLRDRRERQSEHELDRFIRKLLEIERRQMDLDEVGAKESDIKRLQKLLDDVSLLRQEALKQFSAHQLKEDRATDCFLEMCHSLSDKINAKLTRQRLERALSRLEQ